MNDCARVFNKFYQEINTFIYGSGIIFNIRIY